MKPLFLLFFSTFCIAAAHAAEVDSVISNARAELGSEAALESVQALHYKGEVIGPDDKVLGKLELYFKKPYLQRLEFETDVSREITAVSPYDGYMQLIDLTGQDRGGIRVLGAAEVKRLMANSLENLFFFKGPATQRRGETSLVGTETYEGKRAHRVRFSYSSGLLYERLFDAETGKLLATESDEGAVRLIEKASVVVDGIKFPKEVWTYENGELVRKVLFSEIIVNPNLPDSLFDFPDA